ncbi:hypothetical protein [Moorena sp. SIO4G3]|nr:hypothetical protein [Moorena sp. SIO4G3]
MGETPKTAPVVAHGGNPQDRATSLHRYSLLPTPYSLLPKT